MHIVKCISVNITTLHLEVDICRRPLVVKSAIDFQIVHFSISIAISITILNDLQQYYNVNFNIINIIILISQMHILIDIRDRPNNLFVKLQWIMQQMTLNACKIIISAKHFADHPNFWQKCFSEFAKCIALIVCLVLKVKTWQRCEESATSRLKNAGLDCQHSDLLNREIELQNDSCVLTWTSVDHTEIIIQILFSDKGKIQQSKLFGHIWGKTFLLLLPKCWAGLQKCTVG